MSKPRGDENVNYLKLYKILLARNLSEPEDGRFRPKHVVFFLANNHHHLAIFYSFVLTQFISPYVVILTRELCFSQNEGILLTRYLTMNFSKRAKIHDVC